VFDGHGGKEVAHYSKNHFEDCLKSQTEYTSGDLKEGLRKGFLGIDDLLVNKGGLEEVADLKRQNPPAKSPLMKILQDSIANRQGITPESINGEVLTDE
jgi:hypothetical protein